MCEKVRELLLFACKLISPSQISEILIATAHSAVLDCPYFYDLALTYSCKNKNELIKEVSRKFFSGT